MHLLEAQRPPHGHPLFLLLSLLAPSLLLLPRVLAPPEPQPLMFPGGWHFCSELRKREGEVEWRSRWSEGRGQRLEAERKELEQLQPTSHQTSYPAFRREKRKKHLQPTSHPRGLTSYIEELRSGLSSGARSNNRPLPAPARTPLPPGAPPPVVSIIFLVAAVPTTTDQICGPDGGRPDLQPRRPAGTTSPATRMRSFLDPLVVLDIEMDLYYMVL